MVIISSGAEYQIILPYLFFVIVVRNISANKVRFPKRKSYICEHDVWNFSFAVTIDSNKIGVTTYAGHPM